MTAIAHKAMKPFYGLLSVAQLTKLARMIKIAENMLAASAVVIVLLVLIQLQYPRNRTLPLQSVAGHNVGFKTTDTMTASLADYTDKPLIIRVNGRAYVTSANEAGIRVNYEGLKRQMSTYQLKHRLLPGTIFRNNSVDTVPTIINTKKQSTLAHKIAQTASSQPKDASLIRNKDGSYALHAQVTGITVTEAAVMSALKTLDPLQNTSVNVKTKVKNPAITDETLKKVITQYNATRKSSLNVSYNNKVYVIPAEQIASWLSISIDQTARTATITADTTAIRSWLKTNIPLVIQSPGTAKVTVINGVVQPHETAASGSGLDIDSTVNNVVSALKSSQTQANANLKTLDPKEQYIRQYTPTNEGLAAIMNDWLKDYPGLRAGIAVKEIGGGSRTAALNGNSHFTMASIYKLFVDWYVISQAEAGRVSLDTPSGVGSRTINQCIEASIVTSDNFCGEWLGNWAGWNTASNFVRGRGYTNTSINDVTSSPSDTANFLANLSTGSLMNTANTQSFTGYMQRQIYRSGIPAGAKGTTVQDKVGFLGGVWNDAGIVIGPKSTYALAVYTNSSNTNAIRDLAERINNLMQL